jgi:hypothetical protein
MQFLSNPRDDKLSVFEMDIMYLYFLAVAINKILLMSVTSFIDGCNAGAQHDITIL